MACGTEHIGESFDGMAVCFDGFRLTFLKGAAVPSEQGISTTPALERQDGMIDPWKGSQ